MIDLSQTKMPTAVLVDGVFYPIKTDFQYWLLFCKKLKNKEIESLNDCDFLYSSNKIPKDRMKGYEELLNFFKPKKELPRAVGKSTGVTVFDYIIDSPLIFAAFFEQYGIDLMDESLHLHWWKFNALFDGLHDTKMNKVMEYRTYDENDKQSMESFYKEMRQAWQIEDMSDGVQKDLDDFNKLFKKKSDYIIEKEK